MSPSSSRDVNTPLLRADTRSRSRPRPARHTTTSSVPSITLGPEDIINPSAQINEADAELIQELVHPHQHRHSHHHVAEATLVEEAEATDGALDEDEEEQEQEFDNEWRQKLPWWRRPSPWWFLAYVPFAAIAVTITAAAKIELYNYLVCQALRPVFDPDDQSGGIVSIVARHVFTLDDPSESGCAQDPAVRAAVAKLTTIMTTSMGVLTCMTTAWWGSLSDRYGRTTVMSLAVIGALLQDVTFLSAFWFYDYIPGGYWFLVLGPIIEGFLGAETLRNATINAYISDCTPPALRSGMFSLHLGLMFTGVAIGPTLGGLVIRFTDKFIYVFYISAIIHAIYTFSVWFIIPESLSPVEMLEARARRKIDDEEYRAAHAHGGLMVLFKRIFSFLTPLSVFSPIELTNGNPAKGKRRDWSLLFLVISFGFVSSLFGLYIYVIQFLTGVFGWNTEQIGYWFSSVGGARAIFLTVILPVAIRLTKPKPPIQLPVEAEEPLISSTTESAPAPPAPSRSSSSSSDHAHAHSPKFDLWVAQVSVGLDIVVYVLVVFSTSGLMFALATALGAFGMGFGPAVQSVALTLYHRRGGKDTGKLFGAMSVVQALSAQVIGPFVYGITYIKTVTTFPKMIFLLAGCSMVAAFMLLMLVRLPKEEYVPTEDVEEQEGLLPRIEREDTLVGAPEPLVAVQEENNVPKAVKP